MDADAHLGWGYGGVVIFIVLAVKFYLFGLIRVYQPEGDDATCTYWRFGSFDSTKFKSVESLDYSLFPPSAVCRWADGYSLDHVPTFVNLAIFLCLAAAATSALIVFIRSVQHPS